MESRQVVVWDVNKGPITVDVITDIDWKDGKVIEKTKSIQLTFQDWCQIYGIDIDYVEVCIKQGDYQDAFDHFCNLPSVPMVDTLAQMADPFDVKTTVIRLVNFLELVFETKYGGK